MSKSEEYAIWTGVCIALSAATLGISMSVEDGMYAPRAIPFLALSLLLCIAAVLWRSTPKFAQRWNSQTALLIVTGCVLTQFVLVRRPPLAILLGQPLAAYWPFYAAHVL